MSSQQDHPTPALSSLAPTSENHLRATRSLIGNNIKSKDDEKCGKIRDFLFDDCDWTIRYVVGDTGGFLSRHEILLSPFVCDAPEFGTWTASLPTTLSKEWIEASPPLKTDAPISERYELELARHYNYMPYWKGPALWGMGPYPVASDLSADITAIDPSSLAADETVEAERHESKMAKIRKSHLRSCEAITGYSVEALGEEIGNIDDFIVETLPWRIRYLVVQTGGWLSKRKVLLAPEWTEKISWHESKVFVPDFARTTIENAPKFDPAIAINRNYEGNLYDYYGRPYYW